MVNEKKDTLTTADLERAIKALSQPQPYQNPFWIENQAWYKSEWAKMMGFECTQEELDNANEEGFIKQARGYDLYLSRYLSAK